MLRANIFASDKSKGEKAPPVQLVETHASDPLPGAAHAHHLLQPLAPHHSLRPLHVVHVGLEQVGVPVVQLAVLLLHLRLLVLQSSDLVRRVLCFQLKHLDNFQAFQATTFMRNTTCLVSPPCLPCKLKTRCRNHVCHTVGWFDELDYIGSDVASIAYTT